MAHHNHAGARGCPGSRAGREGEPGGIVAPALQSGVHLYEKRFWGSKSALADCVIRLSEAERSQLQGLINKGKSPAKRLMKARILRKADAGVHGEGWSDGRIVKALDTYVSIVTRVRQQFLSALSVLPVA
jgi:hypothetical protein